MRNERDSDKVNKVLEEIRRVAKSDENIMPVLIEAAKAYATIGETTDAMKDVFGEFKEQTIV